MSDYYKSFTVAAGTQGDPTPTAIETGWEDCEDCEDKSNCFEDSLEDSRSVSTATRPFRLLSSQSSQSSHPVFQLQLPSSSWCRLWCGIRVVMPALSE